MVGRLLFDITDGWKGEHPLGVPFVVVTHEAPTDWAHAGTGNGHFVTEGIEAAIARAKEIAGDKSVGVAAGTIAGQALAAGLIDEVAIDLVPVVLGEGHPYFADVAPEDGPARRPDRRHPVEAGDAPPVPRPEVTASTANRVPTAGWVRREPAPETISRGVSSQRSRIWARLAACVSARGVAGRTPPRVGSWPRNASP